MCDLASGPPGDGRPALQVPLPPPGAVHEPVGCLECQEAGYFGRVGAYEILSADKPLRASMDGEVDRHMPLRLGRANGMTPPRSDRRQRADFSRGRAGLDA